MKVRYSNVRIMLLSLSLRFSEPVRHLLDVCDMQLTSTICSVTLETDLG